MSVLSVLAATPAPLTGAAKAATKATAAATDAATKAASNAIDTSKVVEQHFVAISHADPLAAFCFIVGLTCVLVIIASAVSDRLKSNVKWLATMGGKFALIMVGGFFLLLPIAMHTPAYGQTGHLWHGLAESVPAAAYLIFVSMGFDANLPSWTEVIHTIMGEGILARLYFWLLTFYTIAAPLGLALTAVDVLVNGFTGVLVFFESLKKSIRRRDIYVFYGLDTNTSTLAADLLNQTSGSDDARQRMPLLIFCNVSSGSTGDGNSLAQQVREDAYGLANVVFTPMPLESVPNRLARATQGRCRTFYLVLSEQAQDNVQATIRLCNTFEMQMMSWEMKSRSWDVQRVGQTPTLTARTEAYARSVRVWCVHSNPDDDLIFDALPTRKPTEELMVHMLRHHQTRGTKELRSPIIQAGLTPLLVMVRNLIEVRLISEQREVVWDALVAHPLTSVLEPVDVSQGIVKHQELVVLIVGLGTIGLEALRACFWFGRLPGVELRIIALDSNARACAEHAAASWPGLTFERTPVGVPSVADDLAAALVADEKNTPGQAADPAAGSAPDPAPATAKPHLCPTVTFIQADARSLTMVDLLQGKPVSCFAMSQDGAEDYQFTIGADASVYAMVALQDDELSLDVALRTERMLTDRLLNKTLKPASPPAQNPLVSVLVRNEEVLESVREITHDSERFSLKPFGSTQDTYSYNKILAAPWEDAAISLQAAYLEGQHLLSNQVARVSHAQAIEAFNRSEITKLSNRAATRYAPYRLWCLGLESAEGHPTQETAAEWADKLAMDRFAMQLEAKDADLIALVAGISFADTGMDSAALTSRETHATQVDTKLRQTYPAVCALADIEHARWCAFMRAQGWLPFYGGTDALADLAAFTGAPQKQGQPFPHQSVRLMRHYFLVDSAAEYLRRGAICGVLAPAHDRMIVVQTVRAMRHDVIEPELRHHHHHRHHHKHK